MPGAPLKCQLATLRLVPSIASSILLLGVGLWQMKHHLGPCRRVTVWAQRNRKLKATACLRTLQRRALPSSITHLWLLWERIMNLFFFLYLSCCYFGSSVIHGQIRTGLMQKDTGITHETPRGVRGQGALGAKPAIWGVCLPSVPPYFGIILVLMIQIFLLTLILPPQCITGIKSYSFTV